MRLIDADDISYVQAIDATDDLDYVRRYNIDRMPTIDAVPVVRCKDCKWWTKQEASLQGRCDAYGMYPTGEWYCARGERKDETTDR